MQRKNAILLAVPAIAAAVGIGVLWSGGDVALPPADGSQVAPVPPPVPVSDPQHPTPAVPAEAPRVVVQVIEREPFVAPPQARVRAWQLPQRTELPLRVLGGIGASPWGDDPRGGLALAEIEHEGLRLVRQVGIDPGAITDIEIGSQFLVRGVVVDERRQPIAGAVAWLGTRAGDGTPQEVVTGDDGVFTAAIAAGAGVPIVVRKDGFASAWQAVAVTADSAREFEILLGPGTTLAVQVAGQADRIECGEVMLVPSDVRGAELSRYPFFLQCVFGGARLDAQGRAEFRGLPDKGEVGVAVVHPLVPIGPPVVAKLATPHAAAVVPMLFRPRLCGRVVDAEGMPIADAALLWRPRGRALPTVSGSRLLPAELAATGCCFARTDADGAFLLPVPATDGVVSVRAAGCAGRDVELPADGGTIALFPWRGGEPSLRVQPPRAGAVWRVEFDLGGGVAFACKPDEQAVVSTPHAGRFDVIVRTFVGDDLRGERRIDGLAVTGPTDVAPPSADPGR